jgi:hypothetical protein
VRRAPQKTRLALLEREGQRVEEVLALRLELERQPVRRPEVLVGQAERPEVLMRRPAVQELPVPPEPAPSAERQRP